MSTALIGDLMYACGGVDVVATDKCAIYNPNTNSWQSMSSMKVGKLLEFYFTVPSLAFCIR